MEKRTLLQKYEIPLSHLDFDYIKTCTNTKELEKIVTILRSGEEGYYPELTKCAEDKLRELKPQSRALRTEERALTKRNLTAKEWEEHNAPMCEWSNEIKTKDSILSKTQKYSENDNEISLPPVRKGGKVGTKPNNDNNQQIKSKANTSVAGTDYSQWDKYDADAEVLKMELEEERHKEEIERFNAKNQKKSTDAEKEDDDVKTKNIYEKLSTVEKEKLSEDYKTRGNEYFKLKEYKNALEQYTRCIEILPSVAGYNNRAITNLKLQKYSNALADCNKCLELDESNLKAWLRKAEAYLGMGWKHDAYRAYEQAKLIDPTNPVSSKPMDSLRKELGEIAPLNATRLQITEIHDENAEIIKNTVSKPSNKASKPLKVPSQQTNKPTKDYDFAELIKPNKIVKSSMVRTMENLGKVLPKEGQNAKGLKEKPKKPLLQNNKPEITLQIDGPNAGPRQTGGKMLIHEL